MAASSVGSKQTQWTSSEVVTSAPGIKPMPYSAAAAAAAGQLRTLLWSVSAASSTPPSAEKPTSTSGRI